MPQYTSEYLIRMLEKLRTLSNETEWIEFKVNNKKPKVIGEYISALSNSAALLGRNNAYLIWGIEDQTHEIIGTNFNPKTEKVGNEELENWLLRLVSPNIKFVFLELIIEDKKIVILKINGASDKPIKFEGREYIRVGSYKKPLSDYPEKERELWRVFEKTPFEDLIAIENLLDSEVLEYIDYPSYFDLQDYPLPENRELILERLNKEEMIIKNEADNWDITNLGAILFGKNLTNFPKIKRKSVRVVIYEGKGRVKTTREQEGQKGYASGFEGLINFIDNVLPRNEVMGKALRKDVPMYPELAVRELVANAMIHQDFTITGTGPMIEIFSDRMEVTNPGVPLVSTERFLDSPPQSRNEKLASFLRRVGMCEERGSGIDKVVADTEEYQLPAPTIEVYENHTKVTLFSHKPFNKMDRDEKVRACYLHACLKYVMREKLSNTTLRQRFGLQSDESPKISRVIKDAVDKGWIKVHDPNTAPRYMRYIPFWA